MTLANKTIGNALAGVLGYAWPVALAVVTMPYIVHKLGNDVYGILALVTSVLGFFAFLDLGVTNASVKYIAEAYGNNDIKEISKIIGVSLSVFLTVGALGGTLIALMTSTIVQKFLKIPPALVSDSMFAFYVASCGFALNMVVGVFAAVPKAIQRYDLATKANMFIGTTLTLSIILIISMGYGLRQVIILNFLSSLVSIAAYILIVKKNLPGVAITVQFDSATFKKLFRFGMYSLIVIVASNICYQLDRLLIGSFLGAASVAFYVVPASIATGISSVVISLMSVVFPLCSYLFATGQDDKLKELYLKASKYAFIVIMSIAIPVVVLSSQIMSNWMGAEYGLKSSLILAILTITSVFNSFGMIPFFILDGMGMPGVNAKFALLSATLNIGLCFLLIPRLGLTGAALANLANFIVVIFYFLIVNRKILHIEIRQIVREIWLRPLVIAAMEVIVIYYILMPLVRGRLSLVLVILASTVIYYTALILFKVFTTEDKYLFRQYIGLKLKQNSL